MLQYKRLSNIIEGYNRIGFVGTKLINNNVSYYFRLQDNRKVYIMYNEIANTYRLAKDTKIKEFYNNGEKVKGNDIIIFTTEKLYKDFKKDLLRYLNINKDIIKSEINLL